LSAVIGETNNATRCPPFADPNPRPPERCPLRGPACRSGPVARAPVQCAAMTIAFVSSPWTAARLQFRQRVG